MKKLGLISLGCDKNRVDSEILLASAQKIGYEIVNEASDADVIVINTCAFIEAAKKEAIAAIFEMLNIKRQTGAKVVAIGCLAQRYADDLLNEIPELDAIIGSDTYTDFFQILERLEKGERGFLSVNKTLTNIEQGDRVITTPSHYAYLRIADGCNNFCTYCAIPYIRGRYRSRKAEDIISEAQRLTGMGVKEIILVAQDVTDYGIDIYGKRTLVKLLQQLSAIENLRYIRLLYCYPEHIEDNLIDEIASNLKIVKYIDLPLQHVDDFILKKMNRKTSYDSIIALIKKLRDKIEGVAIRSTFICGFPYETDKEVLTLDTFLKEQKLNNVGFFEYSAEEGTPAERFDCQVPEKVKKQRLNRLAATQQKISNKINESYLNKSIEVVIDGFVKYDDEISKNVYFGRPYFFAPDIDGKVFILTKNALNIGEYVFVKITKSLNYDLIGEC